jgi:hypothetical protein
MASKDGLTLNSLLEEAIRALTANDAKRLLCLVALADGIELPPLEQQRQIALSRSRLLGELLKETARNLRLLRRTNGVDQREIYKRIQL